MDKIKTTASNLREIDLAKWPRKDHFAFFSGYREPFFSLVAEVKCGGLLARCREEGHSATFSLWHGVLTAANKVEEFRHRIKDGTPVIFDAVHLSPVVLRPDGTFIIGFVPFLEDRLDFCEAACRMVEEAKQTRGFSLDVTTRRIDLIHFSTVPWFRFTGLTHARSGQGEESEPKITIGKYAPSPGGEMSIPVSITGHHGLMDGLHAGRYLQCLEELWG